MLKLYVDVSPEGWSGLFDKNSNQSLWDFSLLDGQEERFLLDESIRAFADFRKTLDEDEKEGGGFRMIDLWLFYGHDLEVDGESVAFAQFRQTRNGRRKSWSVFEEQPYRWFTEGAMALPELPKLRCPPQKPDFLDFYHARRVH